MFSSIKLSFLGCSTGLGVIFQDVGEKPIWALDAGSRSFGQNILASGYQEQGLKGSSQLGQAHYFLFDGLLFSR